MKKSVIITIIICFSLFLSLQGSAKVRDQWTTAKAWEWEKRVGVLKGFNAPVEAYPGMKEEEILQKASTLGYNSFRIWLPSNAEECVIRLHELLNLAAKYKLTITPVITISDFFGMSDQLAAEQKVKNYLQTVLGEFKNDSRIVFWDLVNEPAIDYFFKGEKWIKEALSQLEWCKKSVLWARECEPSQPITISALYLTDHIYNKNEVFQKFIEVAAMSDIHNFHLYDLSNNHMQAIDDMVRLLKTIGDRPIVCTEAVARTRGGTFARSLTAFSKYHIHFYNWGMFTSDANWDTAWDLSSFEPYEPWFHDVLHPDGSPYEWRDIEWVRNFHFAEVGDESDPGAEITERWDKWRAWKWMALGPVKGLCINNIENLFELKKKIKESNEFGYNSLRVRWKFNDWERDSTLFYTKADSLLSFANSSNLRIMPVLLNDSDAGNLDTALAEYVGKVVKKYGFDARIQSWEIYSHLGESGIDLIKLKSLLGLVFRAARFEFPNQPLTSTPAVKTKDFEPDFDYRKQLIHGKWGGWNRIECGGSGNPEFCNYIWSLSDIISIESKMNMPETGWLLNIANRYGRPVVCTSWNPPSDKAISETLELFSKNKVFWYSDGKTVEPVKIKAFQFTQISTPKR